jgi:hypothetical protein
MVWAFIEVAKLARTKADRPLQIVWRKLPDRLELIALPCLVFPLFLAGFTTAKTAIPFLVGFHWDRFWADADFLLFGVDPWQITHAFTSVSVSHGWAFFYTFAWGAVLIFTNGFLAIYGERRFVATFFTAMMLTWLLGGWLMAYASSAAGPVFAHLADPTLAARFAPLRESLNQILPAEGGVRLTQAYLANAIDAKIAVRGGGISAMPSMHLGAASIYVVAAIRTRWLWPAFIFWFLTFFGSVHFGYHYAVDGLAAAAIAVLCWKASAAYFARLQGEQRVPATAATA